MRDTFLYEKRLPSFQAFRRELRSADGQTALLKWGGVPRSKDVSFFSNSGIQQWVDGFGENIIRISRNATGRVMVSVRRLYKGARRIGSKMASWEQLIGRQTDLGKRLENQGGLGKNRTGVKRIRTAQSYAGRIYFKPEKTMFTNRARVTLQSAGAVLEKIAPDHSIFFTATLPGDTEAAKEMLSVMSGYVINRLTQWIRDNYPGKEWLYVWEWQKRGALHLHMCVASKSAEESAILGWNLRRTWLHVLADIEDSTGVRMFRNKAGMDHRNTHLSHACRTDSMGRGAANYVAKYATKGFDAAKTTQKNYPGRWYAVSKSLRRLIKLEEFVTSYVVATLEDAEAEVYGIIDEMREQCSGTRIHEPDFRNPTFYATLLPFKEQAMAVYNEVVEMAHRASQTTWSVYDKRMEVLYDSG